MKNQISVRLDKIAPPTPSRRSNFVRHLVSDGYLTGRAAKIRYLFVEGQPGQGKTTFAAQFLEAVDAPHAWYLCGSDDLDPLSFSFNFAHSLKGSLRADVGGLLRKIARGDLSGADPGRVAALFVDALKMGVSPHGQADRWIILDDLHALDPSGPTMGIVKALAARLPDGVHLLVISRVPVAPLLGIDSGFTAIANRDLAFTRNEMIDYCRVLGIENLTSADIDSLFAKTEGWAFAVNLFGNYIGGAVNPGAALANARSLTPTHSFLVDYVSSLFDEDTLSILVKLACLDFVPVDLIDHVTGRSGSAAKVLALAKSNMFVKLLDDHSRTLVFHQLFRECLNEIAMTSPGDAERGAVLGGAGDWHAGRGDHQIALACYARAGRYDDAERMLSLCGLDLKGSNMLSTIASLLGAMDDEVVLSHPWLSFFKAVIAVNENPPLASGYLSAALEKFMERKDAKGELLSLAETVDYHIKVDSNFRKAIPHLKRMSELLGALKDSLEPHARIAVLSAMSMGCTFILLDVESAEKYSAEALELIREKKFGNSLAAIYNARTLQYIFSGETARAVEEIERVNLMLGGDEVDVTVRRTFMMLNLNLLKSTGDFLNYRINQACVLKSANPGMIANTVIGSYLKLWEADIAYVLGDMTELEKVLIEATASPLVQRSPHFLSQFLQYRAHVLHHQGLAEESLRVCVESRELRLSTGGEFFIGTNEILIGSCLHKLGRHGEALELLSGAVNRLGGRHRPLTVASALFNRALIYESLGESGKMEADIVGGIETMRLNGQLFSLLLDRDTMARVVSLAIRLGHNAQWCQRIARERLASSLGRDGSLTGLLKIGVLGDVELTLGNVTIPTHELTPTQRNIILMLAAEDGHRRELMEVQSILWPEADEASARRNLDTALSRLRKTMDDYFGAGVAKKYLVLSRGYLGFDCAVTDASEFMREAVQGLRLMKRHKEWQAKNYLVTSLGCWRAMIPPGRLDDERWQARRASLESLFVGCAENLALIYMRAREFESARSLLSNALRVDPINDKVYRTLFKLKIEENDPVGAQKILKKYTKELAREGFDGRQVQFVLEALWQDAASASVPLAFKPHMEGRWRRIG